MRAGGLRARALSLSRALLSPAPSPARRSSPHCSHSSFSPLLPLLTLARSRLLPPRALIHLSGAACRYSGSLDSLVQAWFGGCPESGVRARTTCYATGSVQCSRRIPSDTFSPLHTGCRRLPLHKELGRLPIGGCGLGLRTLGQGCLGLGDSASAFRCGSNCLGFGV